MNERESSVAADEVAAAAFGIEQRQAVRRSDRGNEANVQRQTGLRLQSMCIRTLVGTSPLMRLKGLGQPGSESDGAEETGPSVGHASNHLASARPLVRRGKDGASAGDHHGLVQGELSSRAVGRRDGQVSQADEITERFFSFGGEVDAHGSCSTATVSQEFGDGLNLRPAEVRKIASVPRDVGSGKVVVVGDDKCPHAGLRQQQSDSGAQRSCTRQEHGSASQTARRHEITAARVQRFPAIQQLVFIWSGQVGVEVQGKRRITKYQVTYPGVARRRRLRSSKVPNRRSLLERISQNLDQALSRTPDAEERPRLA